MTSDLAHDRPANPVLLIVMDTLRADMLWDQRRLSKLPQLQEVCREARTFTRAYAPSHWTLPSHGSIFTGLRPSMHLARPPFMKLRGDVRTIAEIFRDRGYRTVCVSCNPFLTTAFGMTRGFDTEWLPFTSRLSSSVTPAVRKILSLTSQNAAGRSLINLAELGINLWGCSPASDNGARVAREFVTEEVRREGQPLFLVVNLMEAHHPYHARGSYASWRRLLTHADIFGGYDKLRIAVMAGQHRMDDAFRETLTNVYWTNVEYLDAELGRLLNDLPPDFLEEATLILTSDHGQLLGEKGAIDHIAGLSEPLLRVPLIVRPPGGCISKRIHQPVELTWLFHLLREIAIGGDNPLDDWLSWVRHKGAVMAQAHGGYVPYAVRPKEYDRTFTRHLISFKSKHDSPALACVVGQWKLICHLGKKDDELYDLGTDGHERENLAESNESQLMELHQVLSNEVSNTHR